MSINMGNINIGKVRRPGAVSPLAPAALLSFFLLLFLLPAAVLPADSPSGFLWRIDSPAGEVEGFLVGSVHLLSEEDLPLPGKYEEAFATSERLAVEADVYGGAGLTGMSEEVLFDRETPLDRKITEEVYRELTRQLGEFGVPEPLVAVMRPWFAALLLIELKLSSLGFLPELGVDMYFLEKAYTEDMPIEELESVREQLDLLRGLSDALMTALVEDALVPTDEYAREMERMIAYWREGRDEALLELLSAGVEDIPHLEELNRVLIDERNRKMSRKIAGLLEPDSVLFVVVGAGHLVGKSGIPALLEESGFLLTRL
jgi:hypothetical protein